MTTINDVIDRLTNIVQTSAQKQSCLGYFAALYRGMTLAVKKGIDTGKFDDPRRMEELDVRFAQRYLDAYDTLQRGQKPTVAWQRAFDATRNPKITVIQHLMLGINAHINLDLAIAAAQTAPGNRIYTLRNDFDKINLLIAELTGEVQDKLAEIWLPFRLLDDALATEDEGLINFSITVSRTFSWTSAVALAPLNAVQQQAKIGEMDRRVSLLADRIINPGWFMSSALWMIRQGESGTVADKIKLLNQESTVTAAQL